MIVQQAADWHDQFSDVQHLRAYLKRNWVRTMITSSRLRFTVWAAVRATTAGYIYRLKKYGRSWSRDGLLRPTASRTITSRRPIMTDINDSYLGACVTATANAGRLAQQTPVTHVGVIYDRIAFDAASSIAIGALVRSFN